MAVAALAPRHPRGRLDLASSNLYASLVQSRYTYSLRLNTPQIALNASINIYGLRGSNFPVDDLDLSLMVP